MKTNPPINRMRGSLPKVGIRPTIDGRYGGVRESLEDQVVQMAATTARFIGQNVLHACGLPVEVVIADTCIGGVTESAACAEKFAREGVGVSLTVTPCWCYGSETMDMDPIIPKAIWGFNGTERPGAVYLAAALAGHSQKGLPAFGIYGRDVQDSGDLSIPTDVEQKLLSFVRAGIAAATMRGTSYLAIGSVSMGIAGSIVDPDLLHSYFGMRSESVDMTEIVRRVNENIFDPTEYEHALAWVRANCPEGQDVNPVPKQLDRREKDKDWQMCVKMALITRDLMCGNRRLAELGYIEEAQGHNALAAGFQGQRQWTDHLPNGDFLEAILNTSFDWSGIRQPYIVATENDALNGVSMLLGHLLTGTAQLFADVRTYWSPQALERVAGYSVSGRAQGGFLHLINSGPAALDWTGEQKLDGRHALKRFAEISSLEAQNCLRATKWCPGVLEYFRGGGYSTDFTTRGDMPVTMSRINMVKGLGPVLQIAEGYTIDLPEDVHEKLDTRTNPSWPTTWFVPNTTGVGAFADVYSVMNNWGANHGAICYGHIGADLISLASILRIPVDMHNIPEDRIFRPSVWARFGSGMEPQAADYRACKAYGPLYS